jgi:hypothetical protein|tara:strand:- start:544 stop:1062 length:519 start_codon:yes stop_codon:yes gene_type:complete
MKKLNKLLSIFIVAIVFSSCGTVKNSGKYHAKHVGNNEIGTLELRADMEINETSKITGSAGATYFLFFKISGDNHYADINGAFASPFSKTAKVKKAAQYEALSKSGSDFVAKPSYTIKQTTYLLGLMTKVDVSVSGYGGVYKNFREYDPLDRNVENLTNKKLIQQFNLNRGN